MRCRNRRLIGQVVVGTACGNSREVRLVLDVVNLRVVGFIPVRLFLRGIACRDLDSVGGFGDRDIGARHKVLHRRNNRNGRLVLDVVNRVAVRLIPVRLNLGGRDGRLVPDVVNSPAVRFIPVCLNLSRRNARLVGQVIVAATRGDGCKIRLVLDKVGLCIVRLGPIGLHLSRGNCRLVLDVVGLCIVRLIPVRLNLRIGDGRLILDVVHGAAIRLIPVGLNLSRRNGRLILQVIVRAAGGDRRKVRLVLDV